MARYNIYAGLGGSFGGAQYQYTTECENLTEAEDIAYTVARDEYEFYEGLHGIKSWYECGEEYCEENNIPIDEMDDHNDVIDEIYTEEVECWIDYYAVLTSEDENIEESEIDFI